MESDTNNTAARPLMRGNIDEGVSTWGATQIVLHRDPYLEETLMKSDTWEATQIVLQRDPHFVETWKERGPS